MSRHSILIVDDDPNLLDCISLVLRKDFHIYTASNGQEALSFLKVVDISLVILDLEMPVMNGLETLEKLRSGGKEIKVIIMTGRSCHEWAVKCADLSVNGYLEKPFKPKDIREKVFNTLGIEGFQYLKSLWGDEYYTRIHTLSSTIKEVLRFIEEKKRVFVTREMLSAHLDVTPSYLSTLFNKECGIPLTSYIYSFKVYNSLKYLTENPNLQIKDVALSVGFHDANHYGRLFRKEMGISPTEYRASRRSIKALPKN